MTKSVSWSTPIQIESLEVNDLVTLYVFDLEGAAEPTFDQLEVLRENTARFLFLSILLLLIVNITFLTWT